jgi:hypothetical protein
VAEGPKFRLKNFLYDEDLQQDTTANSANGPEKKSQPIADLFPNTTVMFGDIAGFTLQVPYSFSTLLEQSMEKKMECQNIIHSLELFLCY